MANVISVRKLRGVLVCIFSRLAFRMNSSVGQPCVICQMMCGTNIAAAIAPAIQGPRVSSSRRAGVSTSPTAMPPPSQSTLILLSKPRPITIPNAVHCPSFGMSTASRSSRAIDVHNRTSITFIE